MYPRLLALLLSATTACTMVQTVADAKDWPQFRGPVGRSIFVRTEDHLYRIEE